MLELNGHPLESETVGSVEQGLLNEVFMLSFEAEEAEDEEELEELLSTLKERVKREMEAVREAFDACDYVLARACMVKLKYYGNIETTVKDKIFNLTLS